MKKDRKRVLFVVPLPPPVHGSTVMCQYIKDSKLINDQFSCDYVNLSASRSTTEVHKFQLVKIWRVLCIFHQVFWHLLMQRYDLCYVALAFHGSLLKDAPVVLLCKLFKRKVVIHLHGKGASEDAQKGFYRWLLKKTFKDVKVILLSWLLYPDIEEFVKKADVMICPNGIPVVEHKTRTRENVVPRMLFLSNLIESKGVIILLDALKILKDKGYSFICDFVGGETAEIDADRFQKEVEERGLNELAIYSGRKYGEEKENSFAQSDIFVFPTYYENECFPLVILEAMQFGLPVVTTNEGAIRDIIKNGENGYISERKNPSLLADCLEHLLENPETITLIGKNNEEKFYQNYRINAYENTLCGIIENVVGGG